MAECRYSKELCDQMCGHIRAGTPNKYAAQAVGISEATFYLWQSDKDERNPLTPEERLEFLGAIKKAQAERVVFLTTTIMSATAKEWQAAAWYLERVHPEDFARVDKHEHSGEVQVKMTIADVLKRVDDKLTSDKSSNN